MDIETVRREAETPSLAAAGDLDEVTRTLADAFVVDPHFDWFMRTGPRRDPARLAFFRFLIRREGFPAGRIDRPASGGAAAVWMPFAWLGPLPFWTEIQAAAPMLAATGLGRIGRLLAIRED